MANNNKQSTARNTNSNTAARGNSGNTKSAPAPRNVTKMKVVYVITQRNDRSFWNRVGVAFENSDGSLNVKLEAIPVNGELHIRDYVPREESGAADGDDNVPF